jgi:hypothetical protein
LQERENLGSHSLRKYPATWASRNECNSDEIDVRGRWKRNTRRIVDRYIDVKQQYMDAKVQAALCVGGPIRYELVPNSGVTDTWCNQYVVPGICQYYGIVNTINNVLSLPILFACFEKDLIPSVPITIFTKVTTAYSLIAVLPQDVNPVQRILLNVYRINEQLHIDNLFVPLTSESATMNTTSSKTNNNTNYFQKNNDSSINALLVQNMQIKNQLITQHDDTTVRLNHEFKSLRTDFNDKLTILNKNVQRISIQPSRMATPQQRIENTTNTLIPTEATQQIHLSPHPRSLYELWHEFQFGVGGRKAAKDFTARERGGTNKFKFCRRKVFWDIIILHIAAGFESTVAIDRVYESYGRRLSVSIILELIRKDKIKGGHPNLRIN